MSVDIATLAVAVDSRPVVQGTQALDRMGDQATVTGRQVTTATRNMVGGLDGMGRQANSSSRAFGGLATPLRQTSLQLSQVAQQSMATGNFMQSLAIQLPDIGIAFGTVGIAAGVLGGILLPLAGNLFDTNAEAASLTDTLGDLSSAVNRISGDTETLVELERQYEAAIALRGQTQARVSEDAIAALGREIQLRRDMLQFEIAQARVQIETLRAQTAAAREAFEEAIRVDPEGFQSDARDSFVFQEAQQRRINEALQANLEANRMMVLEMNAQNAELQLAEANLQVLEDALNGSADSAADIATNLGNADASNLIQQATELAAELGVSAEAAMTIVQNLAEARRLGLTQGASGPDEARFQTMDEHGYRANIVFQRTYNSGRRTSGGGTARAVQETTQAYRMAQQAITQAERAAVTFADVQAELNALLSAGEINAQQYASALEIAREQLEGGGMSSEFMQQQMQSLNDGILDAIVNGESLADVFQNVTRAIARAALEAALFGQGPLAGPSTGAGILGNLFGSIFGGNKAAGGSVTPGRAYVVGEQGPEIFAPASSGTVLPSGAGGGLVIQQSFNNYAGEDVTAKSETRQRPDGSYEQVINIMRRAVSDGKLDGALGGKYGIRPQRIAR